MYKEKNNTRLSNSRRLIIWLKRKVLVIITAFMIGFSNSINEENNSVFNTSNNIEQQDKKY